MWETVTEIEPLVDPKEKITKQSLSSKPSLSGFLEHCCRQRHYFFEIRKCGSTSCATCKPLRLPEDIFSRLQPLPDPMPGIDGHYLSFEESFGKETSERHRPSLQPKPKRKTLPFHGVLQHVTNVNMVVQCGECGMWRLLYAKRKLIRMERKELENKLADWDFTCGAQLQDLNFEGRLLDVHTRQTSCKDPIESSTTLQRTSLSAFIVLNPRHSQTLSSIHSVQLRRPNKNYENVMLFCL